MRSDVSILLPKKEWKAFLAVLVCLSVEVTTTLCLFVAVCVVDGEENKIIM